MKMLELIIGAIIGAGLFFGGWFTRDLTRPTQTITTIDSKTYVTTEQKTAVNNYQAQVQTTVIDSRGVYTNVSISVRDISNVTASYSTNTNYTISRTN